MSYEIVVKKKVLKGIKSLPPWGQKKMALLIVDLRDKGPEQPHFFIFILSSVLIRVIRVICVLFFFSCLLLPSCVNIFHFSQPVYYLRSKPAVVSREELVAMIEKYGFNHPTDLSHGMLAKKQSGTFRHEYEMQDLDGEEVVIEHGTDLMWPRSGSQEPLTWMQAKEYIRQLNRKQFAR